MELHSVFFYKEPVYKELPQGILLCKELCTPEHVVLTTSKFFRKLISVDNVLHDSSYLAVR